MLRNCPLCRVTDPDGGVSDPNRDQTFEEIGSGSDPRKTTQTGIRFKFDPIKLTLN